MKITKESQLGNIVTKIPKAIEVFNAYNLITVVEVIKLLNMLI